MSEQYPIDLFLLATTDVSASSLYGLHDSLSGAGKDWETFVTGESPQPIFDVKIVSSSCEPFRCASGTLVVPDLALEDVPNAGLIVVPGMGVSALEPLSLLENSSRDWLWNQHCSGARIVAACTGAIYLAAIGLLDGVEATTHWAYGELFRRHYPKVRLQIERSICFDNALAGIVTSGGTTAWQELTLYLIANYGGLEQAKNTAKFWLIADRGEYQAPYMSMITAIPHKDAAVRSVQLWIAENYSAQNPVKAMVHQSALSASTFTRRFRSATGLSPKDYVQALRIEEAKQRLEMSVTSVDVIGRDVGYEDSASFRRLFKRKTSLTPAMYRKMFGKQRFARYI